MMMSTFQIVLAIAGVVLVSLLVIYNLMQERRFRKDAERMFSHRREDISLSDVPDTVASADTAGQGSAEAEAETDAADASPAPFISDLQMLGPSPDEPEVMVPPPSLLIEPAQTPPVQAPAPAQPSPSPTAHTFVPTAPEESDALRFEAGEAHSDVDPDTEFVARIRFATPSAANFGALLATLRRVGKPVRAYGKRLDGLWEPLMSNPRLSYEQVEIGLQLVDRNGAVTHEQLDAFCRALYGFTVEEGGAVSCPDKQDTLQAAKSLDMLCMEVDVLIGINVIASASRSFSSEVIHKFAQDAGLKLESDGAYRARDAQGQIQFVVVNQEEAPFPTDGRGMSLNGVTLLFDVPKVADGLQVFDRMTRFGADLAARLEGRLVDDNDRNISEDSLNRDRARLAAFYARMNSRGIPPGGERAMRLFS